MSQYDKLLSELEKLRRRTARFRRVALHLHSPESHDWGTKGNGVLNNRTKFQESGGKNLFIEELRRHFDLVAITDHMKCSYASDVSKATMGHDNFLVLPGIEVNIRPEAAIGVLRLHLLAILPKGASPERFAQLFTGIKDIPDDAERTGQEEVSGVILKDWVKMVHDADGICIAAHVDNPQGVRHLFRQTSREIIKLLEIDNQGREKEEGETSEALREFLFSVGFDAVEVAKPTDQRHYRWFSVQNGREVSIPVILHCDAHCVEDFARADRVTWIKMTTLGLKGLSDALKFPETRIRFESDLPKPPSPRLLGLEIVGSDAALFDHVRIAFAENLNCLIGPRGSGKSTIVEAIRYVFGYNRTLTELDVSNRLSDRIRDMQKANFVDCLIRLVYQTQDREIKILETTFDPSEDYATKVYGKDGDPANVPDVETSGEYPLRLFGWSEIETLGRDAARQRDLLDRLISELPAARREREELRAQLRANRTQIETIVNDLNEIFAGDNSLIRRYTEYKEAFDKLNTDEVKEHFNALDLAQGKKRILDQVKKNTVSLLSRIQEIDADTLQAGIDGLLEDAEQSLGNWWLTDEIKQLKLIDVETEAKKQLDSAVRVLETFIELLDQHVKAAEGEIERVHAEIRASFSEDTSLQKIADLRANADRRLRQAKQVREEYLTCWKRLEESLDERHEIGDKLIACQDRIAGIRSRHNQRIEDQLNHFFGEEVKISLRFNAGSDRKRFVDSLSDIASSIARQYRARSIPDLLADNFNPITIAQVYINADPSQLAGKCLARESDKKISNDEAEKSIEAKKAWSWDEHAQVSALLDNGERLNALLKLQEVEWDDAVSIQLNDRPVSELSPGQRSSAMLPLIALSEKTPLVIDQPEDNLDNKLVGKVLSEILAALKEQRQIIVCTHNPNIVVSGDAEQVIVMDAVSDRRARVAAHGSIDNDDIVKSVIEIMEGGEEAFRVRKKRYDI